MTHRRVTEWLLSAATLLGLAIGFPTTARAIEDPYNEIGVLFGAGFPDDSLVGKDNDTRPGVVIGFRWRHHRDQINCHAGS